jgi:predicted N-acetyltransferase YhbS
MISEATPDQLEETVRFYRIAGARGIPTSADRLFIAREDGAIVGAVRLCDENGVSVLRTMRVAEGHQRRGIGRALLSALTGVLGPRECFLLSYAHLEGFYGRGGFLKIEPQLLPPHLQERLRAYLTEWPDLIPMRRAASASPAT